MTELNLAQLMLQFLRSKKYGTLRDLMDNMQPADIAEGMEELLLDGELERDELPRFFRLLPKELAAETFAQMEPQLQEMLVSAFSDSELTAIMNEMFVDDTVDLIEEMPANLVKRILAACDSETRKQINQMLHYPEDSAGSLMTTEYVDLDIHMTVREAFDHIRKTGLDKETIYTGYVIDEGRHLLGLVTVRGLLLAKETDVLGEIMENNVISVSTQDDKEEVAQLFSHYDFTAMPVVDGDNRLVGIVTVDDALEVLEEEATEDMEKMAGMTPSEHTYLLTTVWDIWKQRIPWLILMMLTATFTGLIISHFEEGLAKSVALVGFIPMLMGTAGNGGSQSSVTIIRSLSLGDLEFSDLPRVLWKEGRVSLLCGVALGAASFVKLLAVDRMLFQNPSVTVGVSAVVALTLMASVFFAKLVGCALPMLAKKVGFDPAVMAAPFITTIVDALCLIVYFGVATAVLGL